MRTLPANAPLFAVLACALAVAAPALAAPPTLKTTELGKGPTIVIVHALGGSRADWTATAGKLAARGYHMVTVDLPGHGDSALPDSFTFAAAGAALSQVLAAQPAGGSIVVGHQFGGRVALAALAAHPELARGLVLIDAPVALPIKLADEQKNAFLASMASSYDGVSRMMFSNLGRDTAQSRVIFESFTRTKPATVQAFVREGFFSDGNRDALALKAPTLMLATSRLWKPGTTSGAVLTQLGWADTSAAVRRLPDSGYWAMKDQPDSLAAIIGEFAAVRFGAKSK
ncbi:MAG: alpha/beta fold hydrolase [Candidatus Eisenbacteria bacterium]